MNPRVSDFGMARIFGGDQKQANTNGVVTWYTVCPLYFLSFWLGFEEVNCCVCLDFSSF